MPTEVSAHLLQTWLATLGRCFRHPGRLFLVGGTSLLLVAAKRTTLDVDIQFEIDPAHHTEWVRCVRDVSRQLGIPVEQASPADFIPLPTGYEGRHQFVGRFGQLDVFHFDFYSVALSKIHRGNEKDFGDVIAMLSQGLIALERLQTYFDEILQIVEAHDISNTPEQFTRKFDLLLERLGAG